MKIVLLHYHLKPGGVTTVIRQQTAALQGACDILVLSGEAPPADLGADHVRIPGLSYDDSAADPPDSRQTAAAIESAIRRRWPQGCDLIHVHNPLLAKNRQLLSILDILRQGGNRLFLQVHDFAEDGRPWSYYEDQEYPADCHYAVINSRDYGILETSGLRKEGLHLLPNMVDPIAAAGDTTETVQSASSPVLYPVRAIRRKNIGEALLLSLFFEDAHSLAVTLPPNSPRDWKIYNEWKQFAAAHRLKAVFEASHACEFQALVKHSVCLLTTSISEGFGFAFLEPWTAGKALVGRKLPDICRDFETSGVLLDNLYSSFPVPVDWIDVSVFSKKWRRCFRQAAARFGFRIDPLILENGLDSLIQNGTIDFAILDEPLQRTIIRRVIQDDSAREALKRLNPVLDGIAADPSVSEQRIGANRSAVLRAYGRDAYRRRLLDSYGRVKAVSVKQNIGKQRLLERFLDPGKFSLLKWCDDDV